MLCVCVYLYRYLPHALSLPPLHKPATDTRTHKGITSFFMQHNIEAFFTSLYLYLKCAAYSLNCSILDINKSFLLTKFIFLTLPQLRSHSYSLLNQIYTHTATKAKMMAASSHNEEEGDIILEVPESMVGPAGDLSSTPRAAAAAGRVRMYVCVYVYI